MQGLQHDWVDEQDLRTRVRNNTLNIVVDQLWAKLRDPVWPSTYDPPDRTKSLAPEYSDPMIEQRVRCMLGILATIYWGQASATAAYVAKH